MLNINQINKYKKDGYVVPDFIMPENDLIKIEKLHNQLIKKFPKFRNYCPAIILKDKRFLKFCINKEILDCVEQLIGKNFALWNSSFFAKPARNGLETPWHQDGQYWPINPLATCTVWLAIDDSTIENGCLRFIKGSHKEKTLKIHNHNSNRNLTLNQELKNTKFDEKKAVNLVLKRGQISLHDVFMIHGSKKNNSLKQRRAMTMRFMPNTSIFNHNFIFDSDSKFKIKKIYQVRGNNLN